mgnify:CR=1 FL=1
MSSRAEMIQIAGRLVDVEEAWRGLVAGGVGIAVATDQAVGMILGIGADLRQGLITSRAEVNFRPMRDRKWLIVLSPGDMSASAVTTYKFVYGLAAAELAAQQRVDDLVDDKSLLMELWNNFSARQQDALRQGGFALEMLSRNDPAL